MADEDLSKLKIDKSAVIKGPAKSRKKTTYGSAPRGLTPHNRTFSEWRS